MIVKETDARSRESVLGITSRSPSLTSAERRLTINRGHWSIASPHCILDGNYDEDRGQIRTGHGPANVTRLRRLAIGLLKPFQKPRQAIACMMRKLAPPVRIVFDDSRPSANSLGSATRTI